MIEIRPGAKSTNHEKRRHMLASWVFFMCSEKLVSESRPQARPSGNLSTCKVYQHQLVVEHSPTCDVCYSKVDQHCSLPEDSPEPLQEWKMCDHVARSQQFQKKRVLVLQTTALKNQWMDGRTDGATSFIPSETPTVRYRMLRSTLLYSRRTELGTNLRTSFPAQVAKACQTSSTLPGITAETM